MASFDFIEASAKGVEFCWQRASYILHVAIPVIFIKVFCLLTAFTMSLPNGSLTHGLIIFPSYVIEAVFIIGLIRYYVFNEPIYVWGKIIPPPNIDDHKEKPLFFHAPKHRKIPVQAGIATYCLIQLTILFINGTLLYLIESAPTAKEPEPIVSALEFILGFTIFIGTLYTSIWAIRLTFLHIPMTLDIPANIYLKTIRGIKTSIFMIFTMMICIAPIFIFIAASLNLLDILFGIDSAPYIVGNAIILSIGGILGTSLISIAITYGICNMMFVKKNNDH